jgi:hypothetical protein
VLHFRPTVWEQISQRLEITSGELLPEQPVPLLKRRMEVNREEALGLWAEKKGAGWQACALQWARCCRYRGNVLSFKPAIRP